MNKVLKFIFIFLIGWSQATHAVPRFVLIPLILNNTPDVKQGYANVSLTGSQSTGFGIYDSEQVYTPSPAFYTNSMTLTVNYGLTDTFDFMVSLNYTQNKSEFRRFDHIGDTLFMLGQGIANQTDKYSSNVRVEYSLLIPTGKFNGLNPNLFTNDATGGGTYMPALGLSSDHTFDFKNGRSMNVYTYTGLSYAYKVKLDGLSAYGGSFGTTGHIRPGNSVSFTIGMSYTVTDKLSAAMEYSVFSAQPSTFKGKIADNLEEFIKLKQAERSSSVSSRGGYTRPRILFNSVLPTIHNIGGNNFMGSGSVTMLTVNPSITYSYRSDLVITAAMSVSTPGGKNTTGFFSPSVTLSRTFAS